MKTMLENETREISNYDKNMKTKLYNQDGSLCSEALFLVSRKPDGMSTLERRKRIREFKSLLSQEDIKELKRLIINREGAERRAVKREHRIQKIKNLEKVNLYNQDGTLHAEAQLLLSPKPSDISSLEWQRMTKIFRHRLSEEDRKEFKRLKNREYMKRWEALNPEKVKQNSRKSAAKWCAENPEKVKENNAKWYANNTQKAKEDNAKWYAKNIEKVKEREAKWYAENTEKAKERNAKWYAENPDYWNGYEKKRRDEDPQYRFLHNLRCSCFRVVKQLSLGKKPTSTFKWVGCSPEELKIHFESLFIEGMTWENYGEWHVDHIRPVCSFTAEEWEQVNHYTNLRPLWAEDNLAKGAFDRRQKVKKETP